MPHPLLLAEDIAPLRVLLRLDALAPPPVAAPLGADALVLDLQTSLDDGRIALVEERLASWRDRALAPPLLARIRPLPETEAFTAALALSVRLEAEGVILQGVRSGADLQQLDTLLSVAELEAGRPRGSTAILAGLGDNGAGLLAGRDFAGKTDRLKGLVFDPVAFRDAAGIEGDASDTEKLARSLTVIAAMAAAVPAIEAVDRELCGEALGRHVLAARANGFAAVIVGGGREAETTRQAFGGNP